MRRCVAFGAGSLAHVGGHRDDPTPLTIWRLARAGALTHRKKVPTWSTGRALSRLLAGLGGVGGAGLRGFIANIEALAAATVLTVAARPATATTVRRVGRWRHADITARQLHVRAFQLARALVA